MVYVLLKMRSDFPRVILGVHRLGHLYEASLFKKYFTTSLCVGSDINMMSSVTGM